MQYEGIHGGIGTFITFKKRADFDNAVLELPGVYVVYVNFTRQSAIYILIIQAAALGGLLDDPVTAQLTKRRFNELTHNS
jgi:hypothetical protein